MNTISNQLIDDLEIYDRIFQKINFATTKFGEDTLKKILKLNIFDIKNLNARQQLLTKLLINKNKRLILKNCLNNLKSLKNDYDWFFQTKDDETKSVINKLYFKKDILNKKYLLSLKNNFKIISPSFVFLVYTGIYVTMRYYGIKISIPNYLKKTFNNYVYFMETIFNFLLKNKKYSKYLAYLIVICYFLFNVYTIYSGINDSLIHYKDCDTFKNRFKKIGKYIGTIKTIKKNDDFYGTKIISDKINFLAGKFNENKLNSIGYCLTLYKNWTNFKNKFIELEKYIGMIDMYLSITTLLERYNYCFPKYFKGPVPLFKAKGIWHPLIEEKDRVLNNVELGVNNVIVLTGPNASGKSTYMENCMLIVYFGQTLGISPCDEAIFTPFSMLNTYINIPYAVGRESLFEAEMNRCYNFYQLIKSKQKTKQFCFTIMDELFTGTNPEEGIAGSYSLCEHISKCKNNLLIISTHFNRLTKLKDKYPKDFVNKKTYVIKENRQLITPFKVVDGVSKQNIALELLAMKGYDKSIISSAHNVLLSIKKRKFKQKEKELKSKESKKEKEKKETKIDKINKKINELSNPLLFMMMQNMMNQNNIVSVNQQNTKPIIRTSINQPINTKPIIGTSINQSTIMGTSINRISNQDKK